MSLCRLVGHYQHFRSNYCLHFQCVMKRYINGCLRSTKRLLRYSYSLGNFTDNLQHM